MTHFATIHLALTESIDIIGERHGLDDLQRQALIRALEYVLLEIVPDDAPDAAPRTKSNIVIH